MNFYKRFVGDIQRKTGHLSCAELGVYDRLLDHYYATERPLPGDAESVCRIARAMSKDERRAVDAVLREFFALEADGYVQGRAEEEIAQAQPKIAAARTNGKNGGRPRNNPLGTEQKPIGFPAGTHDEPEAKASQSQSKEVSKPTASHPGRPGNERFERFWKAYPRKVGKDAARKAFDKRKPDDALLGAMLVAMGQQAKSEAWRKDGGQFIPHPSTWLNEGRWQDEGVIVSMPATQSTGALEAMKRDVLSSEEKARADLARKAAMAAIHNITPKAA